MSNPTIEVAFPAPIVGSCSVIWGERGLQSVKLGVAAMLAVRPLSMPPMLTNAIDQLQHYFSGHPIDFFSVQLDDAAQPDFNRAIYAALRRVSYGKTTTYGALAAAAGYPAGTARAVGVAMGRNPWPVVVPCHRVMASGGKIGGFSAPGGTDTKARLLQLEGAQHNAIAPRLPGL